MVILLSLACIPGQQSRLFICCPCWGDVCHQQGGFLQREQQTNSQREAEPCWQAQLPAWGAWGDPVGSRLLFYLHWSDTRGGLGGPVSQLFLGILTPAIIIPMVICRGSKFSILVHCSKRQFRLLPWTHPDLVKIEGNFHECNEVASWLSLGWFSHQFFLEETDNDNQCWSVINLTHYLLCAVPHLL